MKERLMIQDYNHSTFIRTFEETGRLGNQEPYIYQTNAWSLMFVVEIQYEY